MSPYFSLVSLRCDDWFVFLSCASVFPESPRWLLATDQIPELKRSLQEFSTRNAVCGQDELYPGETLLSGTQTPVVIKHPSFD